MKQSAELTRTSRITRLFALLAIAGLTFFLSASAASAGCGYNAKGGVKHSGGYPSQPGWGDDSREPETIVGLWNVVYTATYATAPFPTPPFQFLESYKTWHHDGTEFENAFLPPDGGNICFGVWKETGKNSVKLHHIGLMFGSDGSISNVFTIDETDTVSKDGKSYSGSFDFKLFDASDVLGTGAPIAEVKGTTAATRITVQ